MRSRFKVRPFAEEDLPVVLDLLRDCLGESEVLRRTPELFAWKHIDNPFGRSIMFVAEDELGIVGFRAFMRWELVSPAGELLRCVRPVDTVTHPRARRVGVFSALTEAAVSTAQDDDVDLAFNTPNAATAAGNQKLGWVPVDEVRLLVRPLRRFLARTDALPSVPGSLTWSDQTVDDRPPRGLRTPRSHHYARWRFGSHPTARYVLAETNGGGAVLRCNLRRGRGELVVSDLFGKDPVPAIRQAVARTDASYIVAWARKGLPERRALIRAGFIPIPGFSALRVFSRALKPLNVDVTDRSNWDLNLSDLELL